MRPSIANLHTARKLHTTNDMGILADNLKSGRHGAERNRSRYIVVSGDSLAQSRATQVPAEKLRQVTRYNEQLQVAQTKAPWRPQARPKFFPCVYSMLDERRN